MADVNPVQVQKFLGGIDYPASKEEVLKTAREKGADDNVLKALEGMSPDRYNSPNDISEALGKS